MNPVLVNEILFAIAFGTGATFFPMAFGAEVHNYFLFAIGAGSLSFALLQIADIARFNK